MKNKLLPLILISLSFGLASCNNIPNLVPSGDGDGQPVDPSGDTDPSGDQDPVDPVDPVDPGDELKKVTINFSDYYNANTEFSSLTVGDFTISGEIGGNTHYLSPMYYASTSKEPAALRFYEKNTFTISGAKMTDISFVVSSTKRGNLTVDTGTMLNSSTPSWEGDAESITFTVSNEQFRIISLTINQNGEDVTPVVEEPAPLQVMKELCELFDMDVSDIEEENGDYYNALFLYADEYTIQTAIEAIMEYMPEDYVIVEELYPFTWDEGDEGYGVDYITGDGTCHVDIGSYLVDMSDEGGDSYIGVQFCVYEVGDE